MKAVKFSEKNFVFFSFTALRRGFGQMGNGKFERLLHLLLEWR